MSFDLAIWEGPRPANDEAALETFQSIYGKWFEGMSEDDDPTPVPSIVKFVEDLARQWP